MAEKTRRTCYVQVRLTPEEMVRLKALMEMWGYAKTSCFLRDLLLQKRMPYRSEVARVSDRELRDRVNALIFQVNRIGVNYNQVVAIWQKQSRQTRRDGTPYYDTQAIETRLEKLMSMTENLRDEFAVILDVIKKYTGESLNSSTI